MKAIYFALLVILFAVTARSQTPTSEPTPTLQDNVKQAASESAEEVIQDGLNWVVGWLDTLPEHARNKREKKRIDELNKNRCPDTLECRLDSIAQILSVDARKHGVKRIAVWYFNDTVTKQGIKMAEKLSIALVNVDDSLQVVDRQHIDAVLKEHQLAADGLVDPETAKKLGLLLHADAIITGSLRVWKNVININIKMLDVETGEMLSARSISIPMKQEYKATTVVTSNQNGSSTYSLPPGFYYVDGTPENCVNTGRGQLTIKNLSGKDIMFYVDGPNHTDALIKAGEEETFHLYNGLYSYSINEAGNNTFLRKGEIILHICENIGFDVR